MLVVLLAVLLAVLLLRKLAAAEVEGSGGLEQLVLVLVTWKGLLVVEEPAPELAVALVVLHQQVAFPFSVPAASSPEVAFVAFVAAAFVEC